MNMTVIRPLLVVDMKQRMLHQRELDEYNSQSNIRITNMINQIGKCTTMSSINQLVCSYHYLFANHPRIGNVVSIDGTQNYVIDLLTERISSDLEIMRAHMLGPQSPLGPLKHEYK
jgi:hypothetical protein